MSQKLANETWSTTVHGITGQDVNEGFLERGTLVRKIRRHEAQVIDPETLDVVDGEVTTFEASSDGEHWYMEKTYGHIELLPLLPTAN